MTCIVYGNPIGKPRQTRSDHWKQRPCVLRYRAWADCLRIAAFKKNQKMTLNKPVALHVIAYFDTGTKHRVGPHTVKSDADNILKAVMDSLFTNDQMVYRVTIEKLWCDGGKPRVEVEWT